MDQAITNHEKRPDFAGAAQEPHSTASSGDNDDIVPTTKLQFLVIFIALIFAIFCVALDNTIIVTAIPRITDTYNALNDVGW